MNNAKDLTFGVEIECLIPLAQAHRFRIGGRHRGIQVAELPNGWTAEKDTSISTQNGFFGAEIVSPILKGENGLQEAWDVANWLLELGATVNKSCGLHVHVGVRNTGLNTQRLINYFRVFESALFSLTGEQIVNRHQNSYCKASRTWADNPRQSRYQSLNLRSIRNRGTVEFRLFAGTVMAEEIVTAIYYSVGLVSATINHNVKDPGQYNAVGNYPAYKLTRSILGSKINRIIPDESIKDVMCFALGQQWLAFEATGGM